MKPILLLALGLVLSACTVAPPRPAGDPEIAWQRHRSEVAALMSWQLVGRLAIRTEAEGWHATLDWRQDRQHYDIRLIGPLGQGSVRLEGGEQSVALSDEQGQRVVAADPETLLYEQLGWRVPVDALRYWVLGLPAPGTLAARELDSYGRLKRLVQAGWRIEFLDYERQGQLELPKRIFVTDDEAQVRLVVGRWRLAAEPTEAVGS